MAGGSSSKSSNRCTRDQGSEDIETCVSFSFLFLFLLFFLELSFIVYSTLLVSPPNHPQFVNQIFRKNFSNNLVPENPSTNPIYPPTSPPSSKMYTIHPPLPINVHMSAIKMFLLFYDFNLIFKLQLYVCIAHCFTCKQNYTRRTCVSFHIVQLEQ